MVKIPVHSLIDLITNSSTEIFVDCTSSVQPAKDLLTEFLKLSGSDKTCDEVFDVSLEEDSWNIESWFDYQFEWEGDSEVYEKYVKEYNLKGPDYKERQINLKKLIEDYQAGKCEDIEIDSYHIQKFLKVTSKDDKYTHLLELLKKFLHSPNHYEYSNN